MNRRGQAAAELALGLLVLVPMILCGLYLIEAASEKLIVTGAATEALWDATAFSHHTYATAGFHTPSATASAQVQTQARFPPKSRLFLAEKSLTLTCAGQGQGPAFPVASTASFYRDLGGAKCSARLILEARFLPPGFLDSGAGGFFQEPLSRLRRSFEFCETDRCEGFPMLMDDWGLTVDRGEAAECALTMGGCANAGYFLAGKTVYDAHRQGAGTLSKADFTFVQQVVQEVPQNLATTKEYQMSFRGEESAFGEQVPVIEGRSSWETTPYSAPWKASHALRQEDFLGR